MATKFTALFRSGICSGNQTCFRIFKNTEKHAHYIVGVLNGKLPHSVCKSSVLSNYICAWKQTSYVPKC